MGPPITPTFVFLLADVESLTGDPVVLGIELAELVLILVLVGVELLELCVLGQTRF